MFILTMFELVSVVFVCVWIYPHAVRCAQSSEYLYCVLGLHFNLGITNTGRFRLSFKCPSSLLKSINCTHSNLRLFIDLETWKKSI